MASLGKKIANLINITLTLPLIGLVRIYQLLLSPLLGSNCRFHPTCSAYAIEALKTHGWLKGCWYSGRRILKCHPLHPGGIDYVPTKLNNRCSKSNKRVSQDAHVDNDKHHKQ